MKKYNLSEIMHKAWKLYRKGVSSFAEARRDHRACEHLGGLESRRVHGGAWRKDPVSGGADPQQQGGRPDLPRIVLWCIAGEAAGSPVTRAETPGVKMEARRA